MSLKEGVRAQHELRDFVQGLSEEMASVTQRALLNSAFTSSRLLSSRLANTAGLANSLMRCH